jgi:hypothetical protein
VSEPARPRRGLLADTTPLRTPAFRRLWTAGVVTVVGAQLTVVAVPFQLFELTGSSVWVGLTGLFGLVPLVVFGLWGGAIADVVDRRMLLVVSGIGIAVTSALLGVTAISGVGGLASPWMVLSIFAVQTACLAVNQPTRSAVLPRILPLDQLPAANTLWFTVQQLGAFAGPLVGGVALAFVDVGVLYLVDTVCLFASIWAAYRLPRLPVTGTADDAESGFRGVVSAIRRSAGIRSVIDGFRYAAMSRVLLVSFLADLVAMGFGMPRAVFPEAAVDTYGGGPAYGLLSAAIAGGAALGGLLSGRLHGIACQGVAVTVAVCLWGVGVALSGLTSILWLAVVLLAAAGAADLVSSVFRSTMLQTVATDEMRGRMQGVFVVVVAGGPRVADLWHGWAADSIGTGAATTIGGVAVVVGMIAVVLAFPAFWRYRAPTAGTPQDAPVGQA